MLNVKKCLTNLYESGLRPPSGGAQAAIKVVFLTPLKIYRFIS